MPDTDAELLASALSDDPEVTQVQIVEPEGEAKGQEEQTTESRERDEKGRFAAKAEAEPEKAVKVTEPEPEKQETPAEPAPQKEPERQDHRVPLPELMAEREKRQAAERRAEEVANNLQQMQMQMRQLQAQFQQSQQPQAPKPNLFENPEAWEQTQQQTFQSALQNQQLQFSEQLARIKYGDDAYEAADKAAQQVMASGQLDPTLVAVGKSPNPGAALVEWHKRKLTLERLGNLDPDKYVEQEIEKRLSDPQFLKIAVERARASAQAQPGPATQKPATIPSLNRQTSAAPTELDEDESDGALLKSALRR